MCLVAVDATSGSTGWAEALHTRRDSGSEREDADSSVPISDDCEKAVKQEDFSEGVSVSLLPVPPPSAKQECLPSTEETG